MENRKPTQCDRVIKFIKDFGSITTYDAFIELGIMRLGARISELRQDGFDIQDEMIKTKNRYGEPCHYKRYFFGENNERN